MGGRKHVGGGAFVWILHYASYVPSSLYNHRQIVLEVELIFCFADRAQR